MYAVFLRIPWQHQIVPSAALPGHHHLDTQRIQRARILWTGQQTLRGQLEMSYHVRWNQVKVWFQVTCPFHEQWVSVPLSWLYRLVHPSHWLWSSSLLPMSSSSPLSLQKPLPDLHLPAYCIICAGLVKWIGEKEWLKGYQNQPKIRAGERRWGEPQCQHWGVDDELLGWLTSSHGAASWNLLLWTFGHKFLPRSFAVLILEYGKFLLYGPW